MGLRTTMVAVGVGAAIAYFLDPVSGTERRARVQKTIEDQLNRHAAPSRRSSVQTRSVPSPSEV